MRSLIQDFKGCVERWAERTGNSVETIVFYGMMHTGGWDAYEPIGAIDPATLPQERRDQMTLRELRGCHTLEQLISRLNDLVEDEGVSPTVLVLGLVDAIDFHFDDVAENYALGRSRTRAAAEMLRRDIQDPERLAELNARSGKAGSETAYADWLATAEAMDRMGAFSISELKDRVRARTAWREETGSLRDPARLKKAWSEEIEARDPRNAQE